jgi:8-oxo-dGTP diphosphatase
VSYVLPQVPASAGGLLVDGAGRLLILKPTYKGGWTIPGGQMEANGESPWDACRREVLEETGLVVDRAELACVDFLRPRPSRPGGLRFVFDCGVLDAAATESIVLPAEEIAEYRWTTPEAANRLLSGPVGRRVRRCLERRGTIYLEDGRPLPAIGPG